MSEARYRAVVDNLYKPEDDNLVPILNATIANLERTCAQHEQNRAGDRDLIEVERTINRQLRLTIGHLVTSLVSAGVDVGSAVRLAEERP